MVTPYNSFRHYKMTANILLGILVIEYIYENILGIPFISLSFYKYTIRPTLCSMVILIMICIIPKVRTQGKIKHLGTIYYWAFGGGMLYIIGTLGGGVLDGFGKTPYLFTPLGIIKNLWSILPILVVREYTRSYLINSMTIKNPKKKMILYMFITLGFTWLEISTRTLTNLKGGEDVATFLASNLGVRLGQNIVATYLAILGGERASIIYLGLIRSFDYLSPTLPNLKWITAGLIGVMIPAFYLSFIVNWYGRLVHPIKPHKEKKESLIGQIVVSGCCIVMLWFVAGVFSVFPVVIATGSMEPMMYPGDVVLIEKITDNTGINNLQIGDVIQFKRDDILICHRIMRIEEDKWEGKYFVTKGDNNAGEDSRRVYIHEIKGIVREVIPKIGLP